MAGRKRNTPAGSSPAAATRSSRRTRASVPKPVVPDAVRELLIEAQPEIKAQKAVAVEQPAKRKRPGERAAPKPVRKRPKVYDGDGADEDVDEEDGIEFEDVALPPPVVQTIERDSDDEDDDIAFEDVDILDGGAGGSSSAAPPSSMVPPKEFELNLTMQQSAMMPRRAAVAERRRMVTKEEKEQRVEIHKVHLLCLLAHVERRNRWCNDATVHKVLRPLLTDKMMRFLHPKASGPQFGRSQALKSGLQETVTMFKTKFTITERGIRRALWPEDDEQLKNVCIPSPFFPV